MKTGQTARTIVMGLGNFGYAVARRLWARLQFASWQRGELAPFETLPQDIVACALAFVEGDQLLLGEPDRQAWALDGRSGRRMAMPSSQDLRNNALRFSVIPAMYGGTPRERLDLYNTLFDNPEAIMDWLTCLSHPIRWDGHAPYEEIVRLRLYIVAGLAEPISAIIWPLAVLARQRLQDVTYLEISGIFDTSVWDSNEQDMQKEAAVVYASLKELKIFQSSTARIPDIPEIPEPLYHWFGKKAIDRSYLVNQEKAGGASTANRDEIVTAVCNALELFIISDAEEHIFRKLDPDREILVDLGPFSTLSCSSIYLPVDEMRVLLRAMDEAAILSSEFLPRSDDHSEQDLLAARDSLTQLRDAIRFQAGDTLLQDTPLGGLAPEEHGPVSTLLHAIRDRHSHDELFFSEVAVDPQRLQVDYRVRGLLTDRMLPLPREAWLLHCLEHHLRAGLQLGNEASEYVADLNQVRSSGLVLPLYFIEAASGSRSHPGRPAAQSWWERVRRRIGNGVNNSQGWIAGWLAELDETVFASLIHANAGLQHCLIYLRELHSGLQDLQQCVDQQLDRLQEAMNSAFELEQRERALGRRIAFRRQVNRRIPFAALATRSLLTSLFLTWPVSLVFGFDPLQAPPLFRVGLLFLIGAASIAAALLLRYLINDRPASHLLRRIESDYSRQFQIQLTQAYWELLSDDLLTHLISLVEARLQVLLNARSVLQNALEARYQVINRPPDMGEFLRETLLTPRCLARILDLDKPEEAGVPNLLTRFPKSLLELRPLYQQACSAADESPHDFHHQELGNHILWQVREWVEETRPLAVPRNLQLEELLLAPGADQALQEICAQDLQLRKGYLPLSRESIWKHLFARARLLMPVRDEELDAGMPLKVVMAGVKDVGTSKLIDEDLIEERMHFVSTLDPFALFCLHTIHGLNLPALGIIDTLAGAFSELPMDDIEGMILFHHAAYQPIRSGLIGESKGGQS